MADTTLISDLIVPELFNEYLIQETVKKNAFLSSGIASSDDSVKFDRGGKTVNIPFFERLTNGVEVLKDSTAMTVHKITANKDIAAIHARGVTYGASGLAKLFTGADPIKAITSQLSDVWSEEMTAVIINTLKGIFGVTEMADSLSDQSAKVLDAHMMSDSMYLLGDNYHKITGLACHSRVLAKLKDLDLIDTVLPSEQGPGYSTYMEKRIVVDDSIEAEGGAYPIYFFGNGALAYNENSNLVTFETERNKFADIDYIISRRAFTMHPRGVKWQGTPADGETPSNTELATAANWALVENRKNVKIAKLLAKVSA